MASSVVGCSLNSPSARPAELFQKGTPPLTPREHDSLLPAARPVATGSVGAEPWRKSLSKHPSLYVAPQALGPSGSGKSSLEDIRNLWTTASLSQSQLNLPLSDVCEDSHVERSSLGRKTRQWYNQKAGHHSDVAWEKSVARDKAHFKQEKQDDRSLLELEQRRGRSQGSHLKGDDSNPDTAATAPDGTHGE
ncbi:cation channel sperm-associated auxiliary subunit zeta isoform X3 [Manis javanica]|uniref:cation channel sperm-associated auxiliary subunit zeta isoform X3 n=1 Tax=Manis javanica TaxID=9974 RepID=UPI003C6CF233